MGIGSGAELICHVELCVYCLSYKLSWWVSGTKILDFTSQKMSEFGVTGDKYIL